MFVDVNAAFEAGVREAVVEHLKGLEHQGCGLFAWSTHGAEAARGYAIEAGIEGLFEAFLPKPNVLLDEEAPDEWPGLTVQGPSALKEHDSYYSCNSIEILDDIDAVRKCPGIYVGTTENCRHMLHWALRDRLGCIGDLSRARRVAVRLLAGGGVEVVDGLDCYGVVGDALERACTSLGTGLELPILNALSSRFEVEVWSEGTWLRIEYERGQLVAGPFESRGPLGTGTRIRFTPDADVFDSIAIDPARVATRLEELAYLDGGANLSLEHDGQTQRFSFADGLRDWVAARVGAEDPVVRGVVRTTKERCEVAWGWSSEAEPLAEGWINGVHTRLGGSHVQALEEALAEDAPSARHRLVAAVHLNIPAPRYKAPIKDELDSPEVAPLVQLAVQAGRLDPR